VLRQHGREPRPATPLQSHVAGIELLPDHATALLRRCPLILLRAHAAPPFVSCATSVKRRTIARRASSTLKALCCCGCAPLSAASAAALNVCASARAPVRTFSASSARQGLCATPPRASRAALMRPC